MNQADDYYPFGLTFNSYKRENSVDNRIKFQGQEHIDDLNLGWDSFKWRNHMPDVGRFFNVDPISEKYYYNSPYAFSENRVVDGRELEGLEWSSVHSTNSDGSNYVSFEVHIKVKNSANLGEGELYATAFGIAGQIEASFQGFDKETNTHYTTKVILDFDSEIDVENDFYLDFVPVVQNGQTGEFYPQSFGVKGEQTGNSQKGRLQVDVVDTRSRTASQLSRTGAHEAGHSVGLTHKDSNDGSKDENGNEMESDNLMRQSGESSGTWINVGQLRNMDQTIRNEQPEK